MGGNLGRWAPILKGGGEQPPEGRREKGGVPVTKSLTPLTGLLLSGSLGSHTSDSADRGIFSRPGLPTHTCLSSFCQEFPSGQHTPDPSSAHLISILSLPGPHSPPFLIGQTLCSHHFPAQRRLGALLSQKVGSKAPRPLL